MLRGILSHNLVLSVDWPVEVQLVVLFPSDILLVLFDTPKISRPRGYKTFFILNSVEHEILNAHKYENIKKFSIFQAQISLECYFSCS